MCSRRCNLAVRSGWSFIPCVRPFSSNRAIFWAALYHQILSQSSRATLKKFHFLIVLLAVAGVPSLLAEEEARQLFPVAQIKRLREEIPGYEGALRQQTHVVGEHQSPVEQTLENGAHPKEFPWLQGYPRH